MRSVIRVLAMARDYFTSISWPISEIGGRLTQFSPPPNERRTTLTTADDDDDDDYDAASIEMVDNESAHCPDRSRDVPRLFGDVSSFPFRSSTNIMDGDWGGVRRVSPIQIACRGTPLSVGAFATKVNTRKRARNAARSPEDGWARPKKLLEGQNGRKRLRCTPSSLPPSLPSTLDRIYTFFLR